MRPTKLTRALQLLGSLGASSRCPKASGLDRHQARDIAENPAQRGDSARWRPSPGAAFAGGCGLSPSTNGNYALEAGITDKLLTTEDKDSEGAKTYANVVAVRAGDEERPEIKALVVL